jgi:hypothetical protein
MSLSDYVALSIKIDWNNDGDFSDVNENVSAYALYPLRTSRGRASVNDEFGAGTGSFRLDNRDGRFSPFSATSPLYPNVLPGRPVLIEAEYDGTTYPVFRGRCTPVAQNAEASDPYVEFEMIDAFEELRLGLTNTPLAVNKRVDEIIEEVLDDISWPAGLRDLDEAASTLGVYTNHNRLPINALQLAAKQELGARLFVAKDGDLTFKSRYAAGEEPVAATLAGTFDKVDPQVRQDDLVDVVRVTYPRYELDAALSPLFTLSLTRAVPTGTSTFDFDLNASGIVGGSGYVTPLVAVTDFTSNSAIDGSGTNKNAQLAITVSASDSGGGTLQVVNSDGSTVYIQSLQVRGYALRQGEETNAIKKLTVSPIITGQTFNTDYEFNSNLAELTGWAEYTAAARGSVRARPTVELQADTDALMELLLDLELGGKLVLSDSGAPWLTQISNTYIVEGIEFEVSGPASVRSTLRLFDRELAQASFFKISGASGAGQDFSAIVTSGATVGDGFVF